MAGASPVAVEAAAGAARAGPFKVLAALALLSLWFVLFPALIHQKLIAAAPECVPGPWIAEALLSLFALAMQCIVPTPVAFLFWPSLAIGVYFLFSRRARRCLGVNAGADQPLSRPACPGRPCPSARCIPRMAGWTVGWASSFLASACAASAWCRGRRPFGSRRSHYRLPGPAKATDGCPGLPPQASQTHSAGGIEIPGFSIPLRTMESTTGSPHYGTAGDLCRPRLPRGRLEARRGVVMVSRGPRTVSRGPRIVSRGPRIVARGPRMVSRGPRMVARGPRMIRRGSCATAARFPGIGSRCAPAAPALARPRQHRNSSLFVAVVRRCPFGFAVNSPT